LEKNNILKKNQKVMLIGFGVGLSAAATIINWK
jgi:3-oxoacyl-[acyl-carrier-protein] synthase III